MNIKFILPLLLILIVVFFVFMRPGKTTDQTTTSQTPPPPAPPPDQTPPDQTPPPPDQTPPAPPPPDQTRPDQTPPDQTPPTRTTSGSVLDLGRDLKIPFRNISRFGKTSKKHFTNISRFGEESPETGNDTPQEPGVNTPETGNDAPQQPGVSTQQTGNDAPQLGISTQQTGNDVPQLGISTQQTGNDVPQLGISTQQTGNDAQQPGISTQQTGNDAQQPGISTTELGNSITQQPGVNAGTQVLNGNQQQTDLERIQKDNNSSMVRVLKYMNGRTVTIEKNIASMDKCTPGDRKRTLNDRVESMVILKLLNDYTEKNNIYESAPNLSAVFSATSLQESRAAINPLSNNYKNYLIMFVFSYIALYGSDWTECLKSMVNENGEPVSWILPVGTILLNTDLVNLVPIGSGWDQFNIQSADVTTDTQLAIRPSFSGLSKPVKSVILKFRGKEKSSTTSKVIIYLGGKDSLGEPLPPNQSTSTSFSDDPGDFHYNIFPLDLDYPVTINSLSITLTCPGSSASIDDAVICFVYQ